MLTECSNRHDRRFLASIDTRLRRKFDLDDSGHRVVFRLCSRCNYAHPVRLKCTDRFCQSCRTRDYFRLYERYLPIVQSARYLSHLTLTIKNFEYLDNYKVRMLNKWLREFCHHPRINGRLRSGLFGIEAKRVSDAKGWNLHVHCLLDSRFIAQKEISHIWEGITGSFVCYIKKSEGYEKDLKYLLKYLSKPPYVRTESGSVRLSELKADYNRAFSGVRMVNAHGGFYHSDVPVPVRKSFPCPFCGCTDWLEIVEYEELSPLSVLEGG